MTAAMETNFYWTWKKCFSLVGLIAGFILIIGILVAYITVGYFPFAMTSVIVQSHRPETVQEARKHIDFEFPDSAKNIQYAYFSAFHAFDEVLRFEAPPADCRAIAERIIAKYNLDNPGSAVGALHKLDPTLQDPSEHGRPVVSPELSAPWFDPNTIRSGLVGGVNEGDGPKIWIDTERGIFYFQDGY
jgi:hypothetical protein